MSIGDFRAELFGLETARIVWLLFETITEPDEVICPMPDVICDKSCWDTEGPLIGFGPGTN